MKSYVVLHPHSNTNPSARFRVVDFEAWRKYTDGEATSYPVESSHGDYDAACEAMDRLNTAAAE